MFSGVDDLDRRLSVSQPILSNETGLGSKIFYQHLFCLEKCSSLNSFKTNERFPYLQIKEDNDRLQAQVHELHSSLRDARTRQRFAEEQLQKPVQDVLDEVCDSNYFNKYLVSPTH